MPKAGHRKTGTVRKRVASKPAVVKEVTTRIDPPHERANALAETPEKVVAPSVQASDEPVWEQLRLQAEQLAAHLRVRQKELDHREAALNSRAARFDAEERTIRLSHDQREADLALREEDLAKRIAATAESQQEAEKRLTRLAATELSMQRRLHEAYLTGNLKGEEEPQTISQAAREAFEREMAAARERMQAEHNQAMAEVEQNRQAVQRRAEYVERSQAGLKQLREDLGRMHRETLEVRLATEELWAQLAGAAPPAALTQSLGRLRSKLADQYQLAQSELTEERKELEAIRRQLAEQYDKLVEQKCQFEKWAAECRQECQQQAARLAERERLLLQRESLMPRSLGIGI
jgi:chromosome segregation ATPase